MSVSPKPLKVTLGIILHIVALASAKAVIDQKAEESQNSNVVQQQLAVGASAQKRIGYDYPAPADPVSFGEPVGAAPLIEELHQPQPLPVIDDIHEHHVHEEHPDPGFWKKKLIWKEGWKKIWKPGKKQIWKPDWKKIWKPIWVPTQIPVWKDIQVG